MVSAEGWVYRIFTFDFAKLLIENHLVFRARVAELVDAQDLKSWGPEARVGSSPTLGTLESILYGDCRFPQQLRIGKL